MVRKAISTRESENEDKVSQQSSCREAFFPWTHHLVIFNNASCNQIKLTPKSENIVLPKALSSCNARNTHHFSSHKHIATRIIASLEPDGTKLQSLRCEVHNNVLLQCKFHIRL